MEMGTVIGKMAELFLLMLVGYAANRFGVMDAQSNRKLTRIVMAITMPAMIIASVAGEADGHGAGEVLFVIGLGFFLYLPYGAAALVLPRLLHAPPADAGIYRFMTLFGNVGFMGFPVVAALFGTDAVFYASLFNIPFNLLVFSLGILLVSAPGGVRPGLGLLLNPAFVASILSVTLYLAGIPLPGFVLGATRTLGQITTPAAMLILGSTLAAVEPRSVLSEWRIYPLALLRLLVLPIFVWALLRPILPDPRLLGITVIIAAMPVAANATMLCVEYGGNQKLAAKGIFLTTLLSVITIPLLAALLFS